jgi:DNA modification methylase
MIISKEKYNKLPEEYKKYFEEFKNRHPTVKSLGIMEYLIKLVSREGALVLDPFLGSGTTAIACVKLNRNFIGIEKEEEYVKIAKARIKPFLEQRKLK